MVLKVDWPLSVLMNRQAALWDCRPDGFDLYWDNEWDDRAITTQACDLYVIPVLLRAWGCE